MAFGTLTADQAAGDLIAQVDTANTLDHDFLIQIEDEIQLVERRGALLNWQVRRGLFGTTPADHDSGTDIFIVIPQVQTSAPASPPSSSIAQAAHVASAAAITATAAPAGGTGATAGAYDTSAHRDAMIAALNAAIADVTAVRTAHEALLASLITAGLVKAS